MMYMLLKHQLATLVCVAAMLASAVIVAQQPPMQYRIHWVDVPVAHDYLSVLGMNDHRVITGYWGDDYSENASGFVMDLSDDANPVYYDLGTYLNLPHEWVENWGKSINNNGMGVAIVEDDTGYRRGIWFDMETATWGYVPGPVGGTFVNQIQINNLGDIVVGFNKPDDTHDFFVYNPDPVTGYIPIYGGIDAWVVRIDDSGQIFGELSGNNLNDPPESLFRWSPGDVEPEVLPFGTFREIGKSNGLGEISGIALNESLGGSSGQGYSFEAFRYRSSTNYDLLPVETGNSRGMNISGDVIGNLDYGDRRLYSFHSSGPDGYLYMDEWGLLPLDDIVAGTDRQFFVDADINFPGLGSCITNRDETGFGSIFGEATVTTTTGKGKNQQTIRDRRLFVLIPEPIEQSPGIRVTPLEGLRTSESGGTATFDIVLGTEPAANVTIGISSSDTTEGTADKDSLTFTPANWNVPQTVTVTGVDDAIEDGDIAYTIITAVATSTDPDYDGLNAGDVLVTNEDDDSPPGGGSEKYDSDVANSDLEIPDNDPAGIAPPSTIAVGDHRITNLTVNVDIAHQRPSDLEVYLVPDGGPPVQLFNFSGDNVVADFNGESSLGFWTLEVYDTRIRKTGTLNSWSITVEY